MPSSTAFRAADGFEVDLSHVTVVGRCASCAAASRRRMSPTFLGLPSVDATSLAVGDADAVILGVPFGVPYPTPGSAAGCAEAPAAIRDRSQRLARFATHHDFDLDGPMLPPGSAYRVADAGDVPGSAEDGAGNSAATEAVVAHLLGAGAVPLLLGGDDSVPIPVPARLCRPRADHRGPGRRPPGLSRRARRRARWLLIGHAAGVGDGARRTHRAGRPARSGQRPALRCRRRPRRRQPAGHRPGPRRARRAVAAGAAAGGRIGGGGLRSGRAGSVGGARSERYRARWADLRPGRCAVARADRPRPGGRCRLHRDGPGARRQRPDCPGRGAAAHRPDRWHGSAQHRVHDTFWQESVYPLDRCEPPAWSPCCSCCRRAAG